MSGSTTFIGPFPPSGIARNYGVNFFIFSTNTYPMQMIAATTDIRSDPPQFQYIPFPSQGLMDYFDYLLGANANTTPQQWTDCIEDSFMAGTNGTGGAMVFPA